MCASEDLGAGSRVGRSVGHTSRAHTRPVVAERTLAKGHALISPDAPRPNARGSASTLLVVCTANIARSPLVAALLRMHADARGLRGRLVVDSAGVHARDGDTAAEFTREIARMWGLDLDDHRSKPVGEDLLATAALVVTMSERQRDLLGARGPGLAGRCYTLPELTRLITEVPAEAITPVPDQRLVDVTRWAQRQRPRSARPERREDVADPYGLDWNAYATMANTVADLVERIAPALFGPTVDEHTDHASAQV